jgi:hypothetical protein
MKINIQPNFEKWWTVELPVGNMIDHWDSQAYQSSLMYDLGIREILWCSGHSYKDDTLNKIIKTHTWKIKCEPSMLTLLLLKTEGILKKK